MQTARFFSLFSAALLLSACGEAEQGSLQETLDKTFRSSFIQAAGEQCLKSIPAGQTVISQEKAQQICDCTATRLVDQVSAADLPNIISGKINAELTEKIQTATLACIKDSAVPAVRPASAASAP